MDLKWSMGRQQTHECQWIVDFAPFCKGCVDVLGNQECIAQTNNAFN